MIKKLIISFCIITIATTSANAFSNSLDKENTAMPRSNNFTVRNNSSSTIVPNTPYNPKEHSSFEHSNTMYSNPQMNDTRYNSNCQFGQCIPGGQTPIYK